MTLLTQYEEAVLKGEFSNRVSAALWEKALASLLVLSFSAAPTLEERRKARAIRDVLERDHNGLRSVVRLLISADINGANDDSEIQAAVDSNWDKIVLLFDPTLDAEA